MTFNNKFFDRIRKIRVDKFDVSHLDVEFNIKKTLKREPNKADLTIHNMSRNKLNAIRQVENLNIEINAGYASIDRKPTLLFIGDAKEQASVIPTKTENDLKVTAKDGARYPQAKVNRSYDPNVPLRRVLRDLAGAMNLGSGNLEDFVNEAIQTSGKASFPQGFVASGSAWDRFDRIVRAQGFRWSIQNGNIQILRRRRAGTQPGKFLSPETGLIESPTRDKDGKVTAKTFIQARVNPGDLVRLESRFIEGDYEIQETTYKGSTTGAGSEWSATLLLKPING